MTIESICTKDVVTVTQDQFVSEAVQLMLKKPVGSVIVVDSQDLMPMPVGMLTDRDILMRVSAKNLSLEKTKIKDVMTRNIVTLVATESTYKALGMMRLNGVRRLPLVSAQGELVGIVTLDDLLNFLADEFSHLAELIKRSTKRGICRE